jgi:hypothetical protein
VGFDRADGSGPRHSCDRAMELGRMPKGSEWRSVPSISIARARRTRHERTGRRPEHHFNLAGQTRALIHRVIAHDPPMMRARDERR